MLNNNELSVDDIQKLIDCEVVELEKLAMSEMTNGNDTAAMIYSFAAFRIKNILVINHG